MARMQPVLQFASLLTPSFLRTSYLHRSRHTQVCPKPCHKRNKCISTHVLKCFVTPCDLDTGHLLHGSGVLHVTGLLWPQPWAVYRPWMTSLPVGSVTGVLTCCLSSCWVLWALTAARLVELVGQLLTVSYCFFHASAKFGGTFRTDTTVAICPFTL